VVNDVSSNANENLLPSLPQGWIWAKLVDTCIFLPTGVEKFDGTTEYYSTGSIQNQISIPEGLFSFYSRPSRANKLSAEGDVLQARMKGTNKAIIIKKNLDKKLFSTGFIQLRPYNCCKEMSSFFYYFVKSPLFLSQRDAFATGTTQTALTDDGANKIFISFPSFPEQSRIVAKIEEIFAQLDAGVALLKKIRGQVRRYRQVVLKAAFEGKLTQGWRDQHERETESASILLRRIKNSMTIRPHHKLLDLPPLDISHLQKIPKSWLWTYVQDVGDVQLGRQRAPQHHYGSHMHPYLRVANVYEDYIDTNDVKEMNFTPEEFVIYHLGYGDILLNEGQSKELVGRPAMFKNEVINACFQNTLVRFRAFKGLNPKYALFLFKLYFHTGEFLKIARQSTNIAHLGTERFAAMPFPLPSEKEQIAILEEIERHFSQIDHLENTIDTSLQQAESLRQSILKRAFEGRLVPQDPNDEPASILLDRIKVEKARHFAEGKKGKKVQSPSPKRKIKHGN